jgi:malonyl-CoA O-methyltransferase
VNKCDQANSISEGFNHGSATYDSEAKIQKELAQELIQSLFQSLDNHSNLNICEIGCGTGICTQEIFNNFSQIHQWMGIELSQKSIQNHQDKFAKENHLFNYIHGNAENTIIPIQYSTIVANAVIQWFESFNGFIENISHPGRIIAFSSFGKNNLNEFRNSYQKASGSKFPSPVNYYSEDEIKEIVSNKKWTVIHQKSQIKTIYFNSLKDFIIHFKKTGVTPSHSEIRLNSKLFKKWELALEDYRMTDKGIPCSWDTQIWICKYQ